MIVTTPQTTLDRKEWATWNTTLREKFPPELIHTTPQGFSHLDLRDIEDLLDDVIGPGRWELIHSNIIIVDPVPRVEALISLKACGAFKKKTYPNEKKSAATREEDHFLNSLREVAVVVVTVDIVIEGKRFSGTASGLLADGEDAEKSAATRAAKLACVPLGIGRWLYQGGATSQASQGQGSQRPRALWMVASDLTGGRKDEAAKSSFYLLKGTVAKLFALNPRDRDVFDRVEELNEPKAEWVVNSIRATEKTHMALDGPRLVEYADWLAQKAAKDFPDSKAEPADDQAADPPVE